MPFSALWFCYFGNLVSALGTIPDSFPPIIKSKLVYKPRTMDRESDWFSFTHCILTMALPKRPFNGLFVQQIVANKKYYLLHR